MKKLWIWEIVGAAIIGGLGALLHFTYELSEYRIEIGLLSPVNESTWEHLKLFFFPALLYGALEYVFYGRRLPGFLYAKARGILLGVVAIVVSFYTYTGILGNHYLLLDVMTFGLGIAVSLLATVQVCKRNASPPHLYFSLSLGLLAVLTIAFLWFTRTPPALGIFFDPSKIQPPSP